MEQKYNRGRKLAALLCAVLTLCPLTACGESSQQALEQTESSQTEEASSVAEKESSEESSKKEADKETKTTTADSGKSADKTKTTTAAKDKKESSDDAKDSTTAAEASSEESTTTAENNAESSKKDEPASSDETEESEEEKVKEIKYIYLQDSSAQYNGSGITVAGNIITISKGGTYVISGSLNGQIYIFTDDKKVRLQLNGCSITNSAGSAINCQQAKKVTIETMAGTENTLADGGTHDDDKGAIFSEDTVILEGDGSLNIIGNYAHGVQSDDDIVVNSGMIHIQAAKSCLHSNDGIDINGGILTCDGGTNGIKTDGYININGGDSVFIGGSREEKGAIYCDGVFTVNGGSFRAIGNTCTLPSTAAVPVIGAIFSATQPANTMVQFLSGDAEVSAFTSPRTFKYAVYAGGNLSVGAEYKVMYGGNDGGSFVADSTTAWYHVPLP